MYPKELQTCDDKELASPVLPLENSVFLTEKFGLLGRKFFFRDDW
jgi:hypothetical protein